MRILAACTALVAAGVGCTEAQPTEPPPPPTEKPIYVLWLNHFKDQFNVGDDTRILNDLLDLYAANDLPVEFTMNGALVQALRDGVTWPAGHGHAADEWLFAPQPELVQRLVDAQRAGDVFSSWGDTFAPDWFETLIRDGTLTSFDDALALELERHVLYRDPVTGVMDATRPGGQFRIFTDVLGGTGRVYTFTKTMEPHAVYASRLLGGRYGADMAVLDEIAARYEGPASWYMGVLHYDIYAPDILDAALHWDPTYADGDRHGTDQIDDDIAAMSAYLDGSDAKYAMMYAGVHTHSLYNQGCMNAGAYDYDNPPPTPCITSPYLPEACALTSYSIGGNGSVSDPAYPVTCRKYLNAVDHVPRDWYEAMYNPATNPSPEVVAEGRRDEIYQRNLDYLSRFVTRLRDTVAATPRVSIVTRDTVMDLFQVEDGRRVSADVIAAVARSLIEDWESEAGALRPPMFVRVPAADGDDYFTLAESYRLLQLSLAGYDRDGRLPDALDNAFALGATGLDSRRDAATDLAARFSIDSLAVAAGAIAPTNGHGDYQVGDAVTVAGTRMNPAEFLLLMAHAYDALRAGSPPTTELDFVGSRVLTAVEPRADTCFSPWCPYQLWTFKPAKYLGGPVRGE